MTPDGRFIAYVKSATNTLANPPAVSHGEIYFRDTQSPTTYLLSSDISTNFPSGATYACYNPTISADGQLIVFKANKGGSAASLFRRDQPFRLDVRSEQIALNAATQGWAQVSMDGRFIAYEATDGIRIWDGQTESNRLVLANIEGTAGRSCHSPALSPDGNRTIFLVASNQSSSVYVHDWTSNTTEVAMVTTGGSPVVVSDSTGPLLSDDGRTIVFDSLDAGLATDDTNKAYDVFAWSMDSGVMTIASARQVSLASVTPPAATMRLPNSISANGRSAAVLSSDLISSDKNHFPIVHVRDLSTGVRHFLGQSTNGSRDPVLSADGRYVAYFGSIGYFQPWRSSFSSGLYRLDLLTGAEITVHPAAVFDAGYSNPLLPISISPDGNLVAYSTGQIYIRDTGVIG